MQKIMPFPSGNLSRFSPPITSKRKRNLITRGKNGVNIRYKALLRKDHRL
jgi:hypothetical protein